MQQQKKHSFHLHLMEWYERHRHEGREVWLRDTLERFRKLEDRDPEEANRFIDKAIYTWNDVALLPHAREWVKNPAYCNQVVGWINLTYAPERRKLLAPLANEIIRRSSARLEGWARDLLTELGFLDDPGDTWIRYVERSNRAL